MALSDKQFKEWKTTFDPSQDIRVPQKRFVGASELHNWLGIDHLDPSEAHDVVGDAASYADMWAETVDIPIKNLGAQHHIRRDNARTVFDSVKAKGFDPDEAITAVGTMDDAIIINGHHRTIAARAAGMKTVPTRLLSWEYMDRGVERSLENMGDV